MTDHLNQNDIYADPLVARYASKEMLSIFSDQTKFSTWRKLWLYLAEAQKEEGVEISDEQIQQMRINLNSIDFDRASQLERELRHDVMAHVRTFAEAAPKAAPIIHLGATSAFVGDNTDLIQMKKAMHLVKKKLITLIGCFRDRAMRLNDLVCLGYTHFQPAQPTTVGKRLAAYLQDLILDYHAIDRFIEELPFRGIKGATGTQMSFLYLLGGDRNKVDRIQKSVMEKAGFKRMLTITGQTYTRKIDYQAASLLSALAQSLSKFANDFRLMQHKMEWEEGMEEQQIGSSAMAYKRNPMRTERIGSLARYAISLPFSLAYTSSTQWLERTLDDSANKRLAIPHIFLAMDSMLTLAIDVVSRMKVYERVIEKNLAEQLPFFMTENLLMQAVKQGGDRQKLHEVIRQMSFEVAKAIKEQGSENDLIDRLKNHVAFKNISEQTWKTISKSHHYAGRAAELVNRFISEEIDPILEDQDEQIETDIRV